MRQFGIVKALFALDHVTFTSAAESNLPTALTRLILYRYFLLLRYMLEKLRSLKCFIRMRALILCERLIGHGVAPNCPPSEAKKMNIDGYRILKNGCLIRDEFLPRYKDPSIRGIKNTCEENAVSLCPDQEAVKDFKKHFEKHKDKPVAVVHILDKHHGVVHRDKPNHLNWWHPENFDPSTISEICEGL